MGKTSIEWTDASWNPIVGCTEISPGCANCYAAKLAATRLRNHPDYKRLATIENPGEARWTKEIHFLPERLEEPRHWRKPRRIFVCDMGDLFHESVKDEWIDRIYAVMVACHWHTFQVLTKRHARMRDYFSNLSAERVCEFLRPGEGTLAWPIPNLWLGVSVENQHFADQRIPLLLSTPAAVRWISAEPLLGPIDLKNIRLSPGNRFDAFLDHTLDGRASAHLDWVVCGGESGPGARPMHPDWARALRDQCQAAGVPFFFKQWGEWLPSLQERVGLQAVHISQLGPPRKVGKKKSGRLLDGVEHNAFPKP